MPLLVRETGGGSDYEPVPEGTYAARCYSLIHFGNVPDNFGGANGRKDKMLLGFEVPEIMRQWKEGEPELPAVLSKEFTMSLSEKANLRPFLEGWIGRKFKPEELEGFDVERLVGAVALIQVVHKPKKDKPGEVSAVIQGIMKLPKGMTIPDMINERKVWLYDKFDLQVLEAMPDFQKNKIKSSLEYAEIMDKLSGKNKPATEQPKSLVEEEDSDDSLPF